MGKKEEESENEMESQHNLLSMPGGVSFSKSKLGPGVQVTKNIKVDLDIIKNMSVEDLKKAKLFQIGADGKPKELSAYRKRNLIERHQQA